MYFYEKDKPILSKTQGEKNLKKSANFIKLESISTLAKHTVWPVQFACTCTRIAIFIKTGPLLLQASIDANASFGFLK